MQMPNKLYKFNLLFVLASALVGCATLPESRWDKREGEIAESTRTGNSDNIPQLSDQSSLVTQRKIEKVLESRNAKQELVALNQHICEEKKREGIYLDIRGEQGVQLEDFVSKNGQFDSSMVQVIGDISEDKLLKIFILSDGRYRVDYGEVEQIASIQEDFDVLDPKNKSPQIKVSKKSWQGDWKPGDSLTLAVKRDLVNTCLSDSSLKDHVEGNGFRVKYLNKPVLAIIDELAYKRRFSYTVHSDLSKYLVDIYDEGSLHGAPVPRISQVSQRYFRDERELVDYVVNAVNKKYFQWNDARRFKLSYMWDSDGPRFYLEGIALKEGETTKKNDNHLTARTKIQPICIYGDYKLSEVGSGISVSDEESNRQSMFPEDHCGGFKKIFLNNITSSEANTLIASLFTEGDVDGINARNKKSLAIAEYKYQNALIIRSARADLLKQIGSLIYAYDSESPQILIEAFVYQYTEQIGRILGSALEISQSEGTNQAKQIKLTTLLGPNITNSLPKLFLQMNSADMRRSLLMTLAAQDNEGLVKIIAEPKLVSKSGSDKATIKLTQKKFIEIRGVNAAELKEVEAGLELKITPTILGGDNILLHVNLNQSEFVPTTETQVLQATNVNQIGVEILVKDGELTSLGAVESTKLTDLGSGIAGLSNLGIRNNPLLGISDKSSNSLRVEFMIRPHVRFMKQKVNEMKNEHLLRELITQ